MNIRVTIAVFLTIMLSACDLRLTPPPPTVPPPTVPSPALTSALPPKNQPPTGAPPSALPTLVNPSSSTACEAGDPTVESPLSNHHVYLTYTADGINFTSEEERQIIEHASVPDGVLGPDGSLWVYFVNGQPGQHGIFAAHQTADNSWEILDCVRLDGKFEGNAVDPDITRLPDGRYRLVYFLGDFVNRGQIKPDDPHPIYSAISEDGLNFTIENQLLAVKDVTDPSLVQLPDGSWLLAMASPNGVLLASSQDGQQFDLTGVTLPPEGIPELGRLADGTLILFLSKIYLSSDGGQTWEAQSNKRVPGNGADPSIVALSTGDYAFFWKHIER